MKCLHVKRSEPRDAPRVCKYCTACSHFLHVIWKITKEWRLEQQRENEELGIKYYKMLQQARIQGGGGPRGPGPPLTLGFEAPKLSIFGSYLIFP